MPVHAYYGGNQFVDQIETFVQRAGIKSFKLSPKKCGM